MNNNLNPLISKTLPKLAKSSLLGLICLSGHANATTTTFTDSASFFAALPGSSSTQDFEGIPALTLIPDGSKLDDITYTSNVREGDLSVSNFTVTTSGKNSLGGFENVFSSGDEVNFGFSDPVQAFGLFVISSSGDVLENDLQLAAGGNSVFNLTKPERTLADGGDVFFLGLIDTDGFSDAQLLSFGDPDNPFFNFNVDDVTSATTVVPLPSSILFFSSGLFALARKWHSEKPHKFS